MTTATNVVCIRWLHENCQIGGKISEGYFSGVVNERFLCCWVEFSPHLQDFSQMVGLWEEMSIDCGGNKHERSRGNIFGKMGKTGGIIQGDNSAGHCLVLRDLIPMNFFFWNLFKSY